MSLIVCSALLKGAQASINLLLPWKARPIAIYMLLAVVFSGATWGGAIAIPLDGLHGFLVKGVVAMTISLGLLLAVFREDALAVLKKVILRKKGGA